MAEKSGPAPRVGKARPNRAREFMGAFARQLRAPSLFASSAERLAYVERLAADVGYVMPPPSPPPPPPPLKNDAPPPSPTKASAD